MKIDAICYVSLAIDQKKFPVEKIEGGLQGGDRWEGTIFPLPRPVVWNMPEVDAILEKTL